MSNLYRRSNENIPQSKKLRDKLQQVRWLAHQKRQIVILGVELQCSVPWGLEDATPELESSGSVVGFGFTPDSPFAWVRAVVYPCEGGQRHVGVAWFRQGGWAHAWFVHEGEIPEGWNALEALRLVDDRTIEGDETVASWKSPILYPNAPKPKGWEFCKI